MANYNQVSYGSSDKETVKTLQELLNQNGASLTVDGIFGAKTQQAVKDYQKAKGLAVDGIVGKNTWGALTAVQTPAPQEPAQPTTPAAPQPEAPKFDYQPSDTIARAEALLQQQLANKPGEYQSQWQAQLDEVLNKILNREKFSYDLNGDMLYQQYKDQYTTQGKLAMMDTIGQAAAMTGGYGNSYGQTAGQQAYQGYLQQLNDKVPELYALALDKYNQEGQAMYDQASLMAQMEDQDYGRYRDKLSDYYTDLNYLTENARYMSETEYQQALDAFNIKYGAYRDTVGDQQWQATFDEGVRQYNEQAALSASKSSGGGTSNGGNNSSYTANPGWDTETIKAFQQAHGLTVDGIWGPNTAAAYDNDPNWTGGVVEDTPTYGSVLDDLNTYIKNGASKSNINTYLRSAYQAGYITQAEYNQLKKQFAPAGSTY